MRNRDMPSVCYNTAVHALVVCPFTGYSIGANAAIAHAIGADGRSRMRTAVQTAFLLSPVLGIGAALATLPLTATATRILGVPKEIFSLADTYLQFLLLGHPFI